MNTENFYSGLQYLLDKHSYYLSVIEDNDDYFIRYSRLGFQEEYSAEFRINCSSDFEIETLNTENLNGKKIKSIKKELAYYIDKSCNLYEQLDSDDGFTRNLISYYFEPIYDDIVRKTDFSLFCRDNQIYFRENSSNKKIPFKTVKDYYGFEFPTDISKLIYDINESLSDIDDDYYFKKENLIDVIDMSLKRNTSMRRSKIIDSVLKSVDWDYSDDIPIFCDLIENNIEAKNYGSYIECSANDSEDYLHIYFDRDIMCYYDKNKKEIEEYTQVRIVNTINHEEIAYKSLKVGSELYDFIKENAVDYLGDSVETLRNLELE